MQWNFDNDRPIYSQIIEHMKLFIISGELSPGDKLPSVRDMAADAGVNPNTMQRAMSELERSGLVYANRTSGRYITDNNECIAAVKLEAAKNAVAGFLSQMERIGYNREETIRILENFKTGGTVK